MDKKSGEVKGMHVCKNGNMMRQEASEYGVAVCNFYNNNARVFYSDTFPQIIQSLWLSKGKKAIRFRHW